MRRTEKIRWPIGGVVLLAALLALGATPLAARPMGHGPHPDPGMFLERMAERLDLTAEQQQRLEQIFSGHREDTQPLREQLREARKTLFEAVHAEQTDEAAIRSAAAGVAALQADLAVGRAELFQQVRQVLTEEQRAELQEMRERRRERMERWSDEDGPPMGPHRRHRRDRY